MVGTIALNVCVLDGVQRGVGLRVYVYGINVCCVSSFILFCNFSVSVDDAKQDHHPIGAEPRKVWSSRENLIVEITTLRVCCYGN